MIALAVVLLSFRAARVARASVLASAGLIGLVARVAVRPTLANVVAGIQIAISQSIRVDNVVVVEGRCRRVEEIALTDVVLRIWDLRRLVLPIVSFVETPFENWIPARPPTSLAGSISKSTTGPRPTRCADDRTRSSPTPPTRTTRPGSSGDRVRALDHHASSDDELGEQLDLVGPAV